MPANLQFDQSADLHVVRISGMLKKAEFSTTQEQMAAAIDAGAKPRLLAIVQNFDGWEPGSDWSDLEFFFEYGEKITRIAIVTESKWEGELLAFAGAGIRSTPVKCFPSAQEAQARAWLAE